jgi:hypothetical protein
MCKITKSHYKNVHVYTYTYDLNTRIDIKILRSQNVTTKDILTSHMNILIFHAFLSASSFIIINIYMMALKIINFFIIITCKDTYKSIYVRVHILIRTISI